MRVPTIAVRSLGMENTMVSRLEKRRRSRPFTEPGRNAARKWADVRRCHLARTVDGSGEQRPVAAVIGTYDAKTGDSLAEWLQNSGICVLRRAIVATLCPRRRWRLEELA